MRMIHKGEVIMAKAKGAAAEKKTARINVLLKESVKEDANKVAYMQRDTLNSVINKLLEQYVADHQDDLKKYDEVFGDK